MLNMIMCLVLQTHHNNNNSNNKVNKILLYYITPLFPSSSGALPQHNQMNAYYGHYPNVLYTMYPHLSMAAATAGYSQPV